jgi:uncharacterized protein
MPMVTEPYPALERRRWLLGAAGTLLLPAHSAWAVDAIKPQLIAAWQDARNQNHIGLLQIEPDAVHIISSLSVPTRAHGLAWQSDPRSGPSDGSVLAVARRPGDWMLRWHPAAARAQWLWAEPGRCFNGHVLCHPQATACFTTETDLNTGQGLLVRRHSTSLQETAVWPTQGVDPHDMEWLPDGHILVANGGISTHSETGRTKLALAQMDSSLVRININANTSSTTGHISGQWRLADPRLSLRHLARNPHTGQVGVALQAEHTNLEQRAAAPLLALLNPNHSSPLQPVSTACSTSGYAGDIASLPQAWLVSCPREHQVQSVNAQSRVASPPITLKSACALAAGHGEKNIWLLGANQVRHSNLSEPAGSLPTDLHFENHAAVALS